MAKPKLKDARVARIHQAIEKQADPAKKARGSSGKAAPVARLSRGLIVLGMHRAGTSAAARVLASLGFEVPGKVVPADADNPLGYWEPWEIVRIHDEFLHLAGRSWSDPRPLEKALFQDEAAAATRQQLATAVRRFVLPSKQWVIKDPRMGRLMPLWVELLGEEKLSYQFLHVLRSPLAVAASLSKRDGFSKEKSLLLWLRHNLEAEAATRDGRRSWLRFEDLAASPDRAITGIRLATGSPRLTKKRIRGAIEASFDPALVHQAYGLEDTLEALAPYPWIARAYRALVSLSSGDAAAPRADLDELRAEIRKADSLLLGDPRHFEAELNQERFFGLHKEIERFHLLVGTQRKEIEAQRAEVDAMRRAFDGEREQHARIFDEIARYHRSAEALREEVAQSPRGDLETFRQQFGKLQESLGVMVERQLAAEEQRRGMAESLRQLDVQRQQLDQLRESLGAMGDRQVAAEEQRRGVAESLRRLDVQRQQLDQLRESLGSMAERQVAAEEQRRGVTESLRQLDAQRQQLDQLRESLGAMAERQVRPEEESREVVESRHQLAAQNRQIRELQESLEGVARGLTAAEEQRREAADRALEAQRQQIEALHDSLGRRLGEGRERAADQLGELADSRRRELVALQRSLDGQGAGLASIADRVSSVESLITERIENRHLSLLSKSLQVTARLESEWTSAREELAEAAGERATMVEERDAAVRERDAAMEQLDAAAGERDAAARKREATAGDRDAAIRERDAAMKHRDAAIRERDAAVEERDAAIEARDRVTRDRERLSREKVAAFEQKDRLAAERRQAQDDLAAAREKSRLLRRQRDDLRAEIAQLLERFSWKVTAPLRAFRKLLKGVRG